MLIHLTHCLQEAGFSATTITVDDDRGPRVEVGDGDQRWTFAIEVKERAPYPNEITDLEARRRRLEDLGTPLLVAPFITEGTGKRLAEAGWSWADLEGNVHLRAQGLVARQRLTRRKRRAPTRSMPQGIGGLTIIRALLRSGKGGSKPLDATGLAKHAGVTQPRASQVLGRLRDLGLVTKEGGYWWPDREALLDRFLSEYRGPGGSASFFYTLDEPSEVAIKATRRSSPPYPVLVSADVGPDLHAPWLRPRTVIFYARSGVTLAGVDLVEAIGESDANVIVRHPRDLSVFEHPGVGRLGDDEIPVVDVAQMIWDLDYLGGTDRLEAAGELRTWLLSH